MAAGRTTSGRAPSLTRARILDASLALFNELGAPNVSTNHIADEVGISPGNLYYHFRHKEDIVMGLYARYEAALAEILGDSAVSSGAADDLWLLVHLSFEVIHDFRFVHRDLSDLCATYPSLRARLQRGVESGIERTSAYCRMLARAGSLDASPEEAHALAVNVTIVTTYWLNLQMLRHAGRGGAGLSEDETISEGVFQVLSLITPYLRGPMQTQFRNVALRYLPAANPPAASNLG